VDINTLISQLPNFLGLLACIAFMRDTVKTLQEQNSRLIDTIINKDNCLEIDSGEK